jgi:glutaredoxin
MKIKIYTNPHCPYSEKAKKFFTKKKLAFEELTLFKEDGHRREVIEKTGQLYTPTIEIDDKIIVGFDEKSILAALK